MNALTDESDNKPNIQFQKRQKTQEMSREDKQKEEKTRDSKKIYLSGEKIKTKIRMK